MRIAVIFLLIPAMASCVDALDDDFYAMQRKEDLEKLEAAFLRKNKESFAGR